MIQNLSNFHASSIPQHFPVHKIQWSTSLVKSNNIMVQMWWKCWLFALSLSNIAVKKAEIKSFTKKRIRSFTSMIWWTPKLFMLVKKLFILARISQIKHNYRAVLKKIMKTKNRINIIVGWYILFPFSFCFLTVKL